MMNTKSKIMLLFQVAILALAIAMVPTQILALECITAANDQDTDGDGFSDLLECTGFAYHDGTTIGSCVNGDDRANCDDAAIRANTVDPESWDIFVILRFAAPLNDSGQTYYSINDTSDPEYQDFDPLEFLQKQQIVGGLEAVCHRISQQTAGGPPAQANISRQVSPDSEMRAARVTESLSDGIEFGTAFIGTFMDPDDAVVYTRRIRDLVISEGRGPEIWVPYVQRTYGHEIGHMLKLYVECTRKNGCHLPGGSELIMERFVEYKYSKKAGETIFYTGTVYDSASQSGAIFYNTGQLPF